MRRFNQKGRLRRSRGDMGTRAQTLRLLLKGPGANGAEGDFLDRRWTDLRSTDRSIWGIQFLVLCKHSPLREIERSPRIAEAETQVRNAMPGRQSRAVGNKVRYADLVPGSRGSMTVDAV